MQSAYPVLRELGGAQNRWIARAQDGWTATIKSHHQ